MNIQYKNANVHYNDIGKGRAIILLHGFLENNSMWNALAKTLSKKYRVISIDLLGHGLSDCIGYVHTMQEQAEMISFIVKKLRLRKVIVVGHSMGGYVGLEVIKNSPEKIVGFCLMNSTTLPDDETRIINRNRAIKTVQENKNLFIKVAIPMLFSENTREKFSSEINTICKEAQQISTQGIIAALEGMKIRKNNSALLKKSDFPKLLIAGRKDPVLPFDQLLELTKNTPTKFIELSNGHMSHIEDKEAFTNAIQTFISFCLKN